MYAKCASPENSCEMFDKLTQQVVVTWTSRIADYVKIGLVEEFLHLFLQTHRYGIKSNQLTFSTVLKPCASIAALKQGRKVHATLSSLDFGLIFCC
jgi:hypothetical protein